LAWDLISLAIIGKQAVLLGTLQHKAGVRSPAVVMGVALVITMGCFRFVM